MINADDVGGVHIKYLYHCPRQLWLHLRGIRPEHLSARVHFGEAVHDTSYPRGSEVDLGAARLDFVDGQQWVHEVKSSQRPTDADRAQARHYCYRLRQIGVQTEGAVLHYPANRRTERLPYTDAQAERAAQDIDRVLDVISRPTAPERLARSRCHGCSFTDYCWME